MQNWKIKRMPKRKIGKWLKAINILLRRYEHRINLYGDCPLCDVEDTKCIKADNCLWQIIEGIHCYYYARGRGFHSGLTRKKAWIKLRIPMLRRWKKILKAELARRKE